jgi:thiol-disulfide isomerase/thioredoxin
MKKLLALLLFAVATAVSAATPGEVEVGQVLRDAKMQGLTGPAKKLADYRGRPLIINVWASWCGPCRAEMGSLDRLARRYGQHFTVIGISTDDYPDRAQAFLKLANTGFSHYIDENLRLENMLGANRIPLTLFIGADGKVLAKHYGTKEWDSPQAVALIGKAFGLKL